jgi:outer membrane protein assembly factor BamB
VLVSNFWPGAKLLGLKADGSAPEVVWETEKESDRNTTHLNALMCTPMPVGDFLYGVCSYGQLRCLNWKTGERRWETFAATGGKELRWGTAFLTQIGSSNKFLIFNEQGELILATLTPEKYTEHGRQLLGEPDCVDITERKLVWSHPAYANGACFARNDSSLVCVELK